MKLYSDDYQANLRLFWAFFAASLAVSLLNYFVFDWEYVVVLAARAVLLIIGITFLHIGLKQKKATRELNDKK